MNQRHFDFQLELKCLQGLAKRDTIFADREEKRLFFYKDCHNKFDRISIRRLYSKSFKNNGYPEWADAEVCRLIDIGRSKCAVRPGPADIEVLALPNTPRVRGSPGVSRAGSPIPIPKQATLSNEERNAFAAALRRNEELENRVVHLETEHSRYVQNATRYQDQLKKQNEDFRRKLEAYKCKYNTYRNGRRFNARSSSPEEDDVIVLN